MSTSRHDTLLSLIDTMKQLHPEERAALSQLAVMYAPVARSTFAQCLQKAGIRSVGGRMMAPNEVLPLMAKLIKARLVVEVKDSYRCNPLLAHFLVRQAQQEGLFERYAKAVQEVTGSERVALLRLRLSTRQLCLDKKTTLLERNSVDSI